MFKVALDPGFEFLQGLHIICCLTTLRLTAKKIDISPYRFHISWWDDLDRRMPVWFGASLNGGSPSCNLSIEGGVILFMELTG
jgi:hypothetical protein